LVDRDVFDRRLAKLEELLRDLRRLRQLALDDFLSDRGLQAQAERWLQLAAECCSELAHHLIADRGWRTPDSYKEAFRVLQAEGVLGGELAAAMQGWSGLRNVLVHLYLDVDPAILHRVLQTDLDDLESFARAMIRAADGHEG
jgi:uncharacterized protein YutE (UPF0331/DUF86 family)